MRTLMQTVLLHFCISLQLEMIEVRAGNWPYIYVQRKVTTGIVKLFPETCPTSTQ